MLDLTGALTSKSYAFTSRPWELRSVESIDVLDGLGSNIRIDFKESEIVRVLPKKNLDINENWISDKTRFFYDGLKRQRIITPYVKKKGYLHSVKWKGVTLKLVSLFKTFSFEYGSSKIGLIGGSCIDTESLQSLKDFGLNYGFPVLAIENQTKIKADSGNTYKFQSLMKDFENVDYCLFLGTNPRYEASIFNLRLRKVFKRGNLNFSSYGGNFASTFPINFLGLTSNGLLQISEGKDPVCKTLIKAKNPSIVYGRAILDRIDTLGFQNALTTITSSVFMHTTKMIKINLLHTNANDVGVLEIGFKSFNKFPLKDLKLVYGVESYSNKLFKNLENLANPLVVLQKSTGSPSTNIADIVLPSTVFTETQGTFYNTEGRPQQSQRAMLSPGLSKDNWKITRLLFEQLGKPLLYSRKSELDKTTALMLPSIYSGLENTNFLRSNKYFAETVVVSYLKLANEDFFMSHHLCLNSKVLAKASKSIRKNATNYGFLSVF